MKLLLQGHTLPTHPTGNFAFSVFTDEHLSCRYLFFNDPDKPKSINEKMNLER